MTGDGLSMRPKSKGLDCLSNSWELSGWVKTKVMPDAVIDEIQAYPYPETVKQLQTFLGLLGYWQVFIPHLATIPHPLHGLTKRGATWDWTS